MNTAIIIFIICVLAALTGIIRSRNIFNPLFVFGSLWAIVSIFSYMHLYTMYIPKDDTYFDILLGVVAYIIGYGFNNMFGGNYHFTIGRKKYNSGLEYVPRYQLLYGLIILCDIFFISSIIRIIPKLLTFDLHSIQQIIHSDDYSFSISRVTNAISFLIIQPVSFAIPAIEAVDFWNGRRDKKLFWLTIIMIILRTLSSANRSYPVFYVIYLLLGYVFLDKRSFAQNKTELKKMVKKNRKKISFIFLVGIAAFIVLSVSRGYDDIVRNIYLDFALPPMLYEYWKETIDIKGFTGYGGFSFNGLIYPLLYILKNSILGDLPAHFQTIYDLISSTDSSWKSVGQSIRANAYVTCFWYFYADAREFGIVIGSYIFGLLSSSIYRNALRNRNSKNISVYCLIFNTVFYSFSRLQVSQARVMIGLLFIMFIAYRKSYFDNRFREDEFPAVFPIMTRDSI